MIRDCGDWLFVTSWSINLAAEDGTPTTAETIEQRINFEEHGSIIWWNDAKTFLPEEDYTSGSGSKRAKKEIDISIGSTQVHHGMVWLTGPELQHSADLIWRF